MTEGFVFLHAPRLHDEWLWVVRGLLLDVDDEFVPPLSSRTSTHDRDLDAVVGMSASANPEGAAAPLGVERYLAGVAEQSCVLAFKSGALVGLLSYQRDAELPDIGVSAPSAYVSTVVVSKDVRRQGLAQSLYEHLESVMPVGAVVATRTWSGNSSHIGLLGDRGYSLVKTEPDARGPGISTVYYSKTLA